MLLTDWDLDLTVVDVLRGQGVDLHVILQRRPALVQAAEWAIKEGMPLLQPRVTTCQVEVLEIRHERVLLAGPGIINSPLVAGHLAGAQRLAVMLCTIGPQLEAVAGQVLSDDPLLGLALDGLGSAAVERLASLAVTRLETQAHLEGLEASIPLSPGMVGWPVDPGQAQVFALLEGNTSGVRLNESGMMQPLKSLTEVLGLGLHMNAGGIPCDFCALQYSCRYQERVQ